MDSLIDGQETLLTYYKNRFFENTKLDRYIPTPKYGSILILHDAYVSIPLYFSIKTHVFIAEIFDRSVSDFEITERVELVSKAIL